MKFTGTVSSRDESTATVTVEIVGRNSWGDHVTGSVRLDLPRGA